MPIIPTHFALAGLFSWAGYQLFSPNERTRPATKKPTGGDTPRPETIVCGHYVWNVLDVDAALQEAMADGERDPEVLALAVARIVYAMTPDGEPQVWPAAPSDERAVCIYEWIVEHIERRLVGDDPVAPPRLDPQEPSEPDDPTAPLYPEPAPIDLEPWTDPGNYPTPGMFHQIGGDNSAQTIQGIARKALTTAFYLALNDLDRAIELAREKRNWELYREAINCVPWNHAVFGSANEPGTSGYYVTPHGDSISMFPVHAKVADQLLRGEPVQRRVRTGNRARPAGGGHAFPWLPPLDEDELRAGRVTLSREQWDNGDPVVQPPPEVLALGLKGVPHDRVWGCMGHASAMDEVPRW